MPMLPTDRPDAVDTKTGRLICATIALRLRRELDAESEPLPRRLAVLLNEIQQRDDEV